MLPRSPGSDRPTQLVLARHAQTALNVSGRLRGRVDPPLTATGQQQARALGRALVERTPTALYCSPRQRATATATIVGESVGLEAVTMAELDDFDYGAWAGHDDIEIEEQWPALHATWKADPEAITFPDGESFPQASRRIASFVRLVQDRHPGALVVAITHDAIVRCAVCSALDAPSAAYHRIAIDLASTTGIVVGGGTPQVLWVNESFHVRWL